MQVVSGAPPGHKSSKTLYVMLLKITKLNFKTRNVRKQPIVFVSSIYLVFLGIEFRLNVLFLNFYRREMSLECNYWVWRQNYFVIKTTLNYKLHHFLASGKRTWINNIRNGYSRNKWENNDPNKHTHKQTNKYKVEKAEHKNGISKKNRFSLILVRAV